MKVPSFFLFAFLLIWACENPETVRKKKYISIGKQLYQTNCVRCHGPEGKGLGTLYPPLAGSKFLKENLNMVPCIIKFGAEGPLMVNGVEYNQPMPANPELYDQEIAQIINYLQNAWGGEAEFYPVDSVAKALKACR